MHDCHAGIRNALVSLPPFRRPHLPEATVFLHGYSLSVRSPEPAHILSNERGARPGLEFHNKPAFHFHWSTDSTAFRNASWEL